MTGMSGFDPDEIVQLVADTKDMLPLAAQGRRAPDIGSPVRVSQPVETTAVAGQGRKK